MMRTEVARRYAAGESIHGIATALRLHTSTVSRWVHTDVGVRAAGRPRIATITDAELIGLRDQAKLSWRAIGDRLGISSTQARRRYLAAVAAADSVVDDLAETDAASVYGAFHAAIDAAADEGLTTPCRLSAEFDADGLTPAAAATLATRCRAECPVLTQCRPLAVLTTPYLQTPAVIAGRLHRPVQPWVRVYEQIDAALDAGVYPAGHALPPIRELAKKADAHSNSVRAAIHHLLTEGRLIDDGQAIRATAAVTAA